MKNNFILISHAQQPAVRRRNRRRPSPHPA
jgi:hypothetical protein